MSSEYPAKEIPANTPDYFCSSCGTRLKNKASFCTECGTVVQAIQHAPTTIPTGPHPPKANRTLMIIGLVFISIGIMAAIGAGLLFFITMGWLYL
ncbi:MAG: zinc-ribbon domain-containing protein, partial [Candidatus Heimdallarchaeaceae archaeon]